MARILTVGIATLDIVNQVSAYPAEDDEIRATAQTIRRGGNATNTAVVLSQLGHQVDWAGALVQQPNNAAITEDLINHNIGMQYCQSVTTGTMPTSYIILSEQTGSRTIVHMRDCPEYRFADFQRIALTAFDWLHFEGRNIAETEKMLRYVRTHYPQLRCSVEIEKPREGIERLFPMADFLMFSKHYVTAKGFEHAESFLQQLPDAFVASCSWGTEGVWAKKQPKIISQTAFSPDTVVDTIGAGDCLNAGLIDGLVQQRNLPETLRFASQLAGLKCGQSGLSNLTQQINGIL